MTATNDIEEATLKKLERLLKRPGDTDHAIADGIACRPLGRNYLELSTTEQAIKALEVARPNTDEYDLILMKWIELETDVQALVQICIFPAANTRKPVRLLVETKIVGLCETKDDIRAARTAIHPGNSMWPTLVHKGLLILQKEKRV